MNTIDVWLIDLETHQGRLSEYRQMLSDEEIERADRFHFEVDRIGYTIFHGALREIISQYLDKNSMAVRFSSKTNGKPYLTDFPEWRFNLSHTKTHALLAISKGIELGVDIERNKRIVDYLPMARRFFHPDEYVQLLDFSAEEQQAAFFKFWTAKEAFVKAVGEGVSFGLDKFAISLSSPSRVAWIAAEKQVCASYFQLSYLPSPPNHTSCLVYFGQPCLIDLKKY